MRCDLKLLITHPADNSRSNRAVLLLKRWRISTRALSNLMGVCSGGIETPQATAAAFEDGWFKTGDLAQMTARGYLRVTGRKGSMISTASENVSAMEVERVLLEHPDVAQACVYGVPDEVLGEAVHAAVVVRKTAAADASASQLAAALHQHAARFLAAYKVPHVEIVDALPLTGSGKVARAAVKRRGRDAAEAARAPALAAAAVLLTPAAAAVMRAAQPCEELLSRTSALVSAVLGHSGGAAGGVGPRL
jgi:acyl-CoA synthetase (AMP-forming)/AMP-acid ligase II